MFVVCHNTIYTCVCDIPWYKAYLFHVKLHGFCKHLHIYTSCKIPMMLEGLNKMLLVEKE